MADYRAGLAAFSRGDRPESRRLLQKAADEGSAGAAAVLGCAYLSGDWCPRNLRKALPLLRAGAAKGQVHAMCGLAYAYMMGLGVTRNYGAARYWLRRAWTANPTFALLRFFAKNF